MKNNNEFSGNTEFQNFVMPGEEQRKLVELDEMWLQRALSGTALNNTIELSADE